MQLSPNVSCNGTINPDFSNIEADVLQLDNEFFEQTEAYMEHNQKLKTKSFEIIIISYSKITQVSYLRTLISLQIQLTVLQPRSISSLLLYNPAFVHLNLFSSHKHQFILHELSNFSGSIFYFDNLTQSVSRIL